MSESKAVARGYSWPPFAVGNTAALKSGAHSPRVYGQLADDLVAWVLEQRDDLKRFGPALYAWAVAEARVHLYRVQLEQTETPTDAQLGWWIRLERAAEQRREHLGLDPRFEAMLRKDQADAAVGFGSLQQLLDRGGADLDARDDSPPALEVAGGE